MFFLVFFSISMVFREVFFFSRHRCVLLLCLCYRKKKITRDLGWMRCHVFIWCLHFSFDIYIWTFRGSSERRVFLGATYSLRSNSMISNWISFGANQRRNTSTFSRIHVNQSKNHKNFHSFFFFFEQIRTNNRKTIAKRYRKSKTSVTW